jgi:dihydrofolate synthase / folylpolyglutamate synthase
MLTNPVNPQPKLDALLDVIASRHPSKMALGLCRLKAFLGHNPWHQFDCPVISVAGTNGKGSCVQSLVNLYTAMGYQVGSTTSPHLYHVCERIAINDQAIDASHLLEVLTAVDSQAQK